MDLLLEVQWEYLSGTEWVHENYSEEEKNNFFCSDIQISVHNVQWLPQKNKVPLRIDEPYQLGIQSICQNINITMTLSTMADNPLYLYSVTNLNIYVSMIQNLKDLNKEV